MKTVKSVASAKQNNVYNVSQQECFMKFEIKYFVFLCIFTDHFSGAGRAVGRLSVRHLCVCTISLELNDL